MDVLEIKKRQLYGWLDRCIINMKDFKTNFNNMSIQEKVDFARRQYYLLYLLNNFLSGRSKLEGVDTKRVDYDRAMNKLQQKVINNNNNSGD